MRDLILDETVVAIVVQRRLRLVMLLNHVVLVLRLTRVMLSQGSRCTVHFRMMVDVWGGMMDGVLGACMRVLVDHSWDVVLTLIMMVDVVIEIIICMQILPVRADMVAKNLHIMVIVWVMTDMILNSWHGFHDCWHGSNHRGSNHWCSNHGGSSDYRSNNLGRLLVVIGDISDCGMVNRFVLMELVMDLRDHTVMVNGHIEASHVSVVLGCDDTLELLDAVSVVRGWVDMSFSEVMAAVVVVMELLAMVQLSVMVTIESMLDIGLMLDCMVLEASMLLAEAWMGDPLMELGAMVLITIIWIHVFNMGFVVMRRLMVGVLIEVNRMFEVVLVI